MLPVLRQGHGASAKQGHPRCGCKNAKACGSIRVEITEPELCWTSYTYFLFLWFSL